MVGSLSDADVAFVDGLLTGEDADLAAFTYYKSAGSFGALGSNNN